MTRSASTGTNRQASGASNSRPFSQPTGRRTISARCPAACRAATRLSWCCSAPPRTNGFCAPHTTTSISDSSAVACCRGPQATKPYYRWLADDDGQPQRQLGPNLGGHRFRGGMSTVPSSPHGHAAFNADVEPLQRVNAPRSFWGGFGATVREVVQYRELLGQLVRKE